MLEFLLNPSWVLSFREDFLTSFLGIFPIFATSQFYIACIAVGYWRSYARMWVALGFLVPCVTLINCILKYLFRIERPDFSLHLVPVEDMYGFPSGDVMVGFVFWMRLYFSTENIYQKLFCIFLILCISVSRIYLGVHSLLDVLGAITIGWLILDMWYKIDLLNPDLLERNLIRFWLIPIYLAAVYLVVAADLEPASVAIKSFGALLGYALALPIVRRNFGLSKPNHPIKILLSFIVIVLFATYYSQINQYDIFGDQGDIALKYMIITFMIFGLIPFILNRIR